MSRSGWQASGSSDWKVTIPPFWGLWQTDQWETGAQAAPDKTDNRRGDPTALDPDICFLPPLSTKHDPTETQQPQPGAALQ